MQFAGVDSSSPPVIDIPRQCMELLDLEKPTPDACAEPRLGQVAGAPLVFRAITYGSGKRYFSGILRGARASS